MKRYFIFSFLLVLVVALSAPLALSQTTSVKGVCKDLDGKPIAGAQVEWQGTETGHNYSVKTNNKGEYFSLGISPGKYNVKLNKDGKEIYHFSNITVGMDEVTVDFDLKKEQAAMAKGQGLSAEDAKAAQEQQAKAAKEKDTVKLLNEKIAEAKTASDAGDFEKAISILNDANALDNTRDLLWFKLADAYRSSAPKQTDPDEKKKRYETAAADYQKAIDLRKASEVAQKDPTNNKTMAAYYNNLGESYAKANKVEDATAAYNQAAQLDPPGAMYYFNEGAALTNAGRADDAIAAFDKTIAADPTRALAYYWKGINLIGKATVDKDNKMTAPTGTAEAFQKYLELDPNGSMAQTAKDMLATIGTTVETGFGSKKKPVKK
ncbi:MAG: carboxypeptidase regulatory-like domain-containing protein [Terriglobales bacterium]